MVITIGKEEKTEPFNTQKQSTGKCINKFKIKPKWQIKYKQKTRGRSLLSIGRQEKKKTLYYFNRKFMLEISYEEMFLLKQTFIIF